MPLTFRLTDDTADGVSLEADAIDFDGTLELTLRRDTGALGTLATSIEELRRWVAAVGQESTVQMREGVR